MQKLMTLVVILLTLVSGCSFRSMLGLRNTAPRAVAYVTNRSAGTVSVIDTRRHEVTARIRVGNDPVAITLGPDHRIAYVANRCGDDPDCGRYGSVSAIATENDAVIATIPLNYSGDTCKPSGVAVTPNGQLAYVPSQCEGNFRPGLIAVIDTARNTLTASIQSSAAPQDVALAADGRFAYVTHVSSGLSVIDTAINTVAATIRDVLTGGGMTISPDGRFIYVASGCARLESRCSFSGVSVIDAATNAVVTSIPLTGSPAGVAISPDGRFVYVMNTTEPAEDAVAIIDASTNKVTGSIRIGETFCRIAVGPNNQFAYATNCHIGRIAVIDTVASTVTTTVPVGGAPWGIAIGTL